MRSCLTPALRLESSSEATTLPGLDFVMRQHGMPRNRQQPLRSSLHAAAKERGLSLSLLLLRSSDPVSRTAGPPARSSPAPSSSAPAG